LSRSWMFPTSFALVSLVACDPPSKSIGGDLVDDPTDKTVPKDSTASDEDADDPMGESPTTDPPESDEPTESDDGVMEETSSELLTYEDVAVVFARCVSCHTNSNNAFRVTDGPELWIATRSASQPFTLIVPGNPEDSYIFMKIVGDDRIQGRQMPSDVNALPDQDVALIEAWIEDGALD